MKNSKLKNKYLKKTKIAITSKTFSNDKYLVSELKKYFDNVKINDCKNKLRDNSLVDFLKNSSGVILGTEKLTSEIVEQLPDLRFVSKYGVGTCNIDLDALKYNNIKFICRKGVNSESVAELVIAQTLSLIRNIDQSQKSFRKGKWEKLTGRELAEIAVGIIGFGHIGKAVAEKFAVLGAGSIFVNDLIDFKDCCYSYKFVSLDELLASSDIVTLHIDADNRNFNFVDADLISKMKKGAYLINTSRGAILDESALVNALKTHRLAGAALDVYKDEIEINKCLCSCPNLLTTCHIGGSSNRAVKKMGIAAIEGLLEMLRLD